MSALSALVRATHPVPAAAVTALAGAVLAARGAPPSILALATGSVLAGQASVGWSNDYLDRHHDRGRADKPIPAGDVRARTVALASLAALVVCIGLSIPLGFVETSVMAAAVGSAWAYNAGLKGTSLSWFPYVVSFGLAPVYLWLAAGDGFPRAWVAAGAALLGLAGHLTNVLPDLEADRERGARGLPHRLGPRASLIAAALALAGAGGLVLGFSDRAGPGALAAGAAAALLIGGVVVAGARGRPRLAFLLTVAAAGAVVALFLQSA